MKSYKRVLVKISGEAFLGSLSFGIESQATLKIASLLGELLKEGYEVACVLGGGNIFRGVQKSSELKIARTPADQMGMLATFFNGIALKEALKALGMPVFLMSALECPSLVEKYNWEKAVELLKQKQLLLFVGGMGHPFFTTDTTAALRASEIGADLILKGTTRVDGIYDKDPLLHKEAKKYDQISYQKIVEEKLGIIDLTAAALCMSNQIPMRVFNMQTTSFLQAVKDGASGTLVT